MHLTEVWLSVHLEHKYRYLPTAHLEAFDDEAESGELAAAVADQLVCKAGGEELLEPQSLEAGEDCTNPRVQLRPAPHVRQDRQQMVIWCGFWLSEMEDG